MDNCHDETFEPHGDPMTQTTNRIFDDFAKLMTDAAGAAQGLKREMETVVRAQGERVLAEYDVVRRDEFDAVKAMAAKAREENEQLQARVEALEAAIRDMRTGGGP